MKEVILIPSYEPDNKLINVIDTIDRKRFDIVLVDDGSGPNYQDVFNKVKSKVHFISYKDNMGKGYALKTGINYIKEKYIKDYIIVTMDSDGQHKIEDAINLIDYLKEHKKEYVLGKRVRNEKTPLRSKIGNTITKFVFHLLTGINIYDTQTGLRAFTDNLTDFMLSIPGNRFEYEMNCLLQCSKNGIKMHEIEIKTIYYNKNKGTQFKTLRDSYLIYKDIIKFGVSSFLSFLIDYSLFALFSYFINQITICNVFARIISASFNFIINRKYVFKSDKKLYRSIVSYIVLAFGILVLNTLLLNILVYQLSIHKLLAKILVEILLFFISFIIQQRIVFKKK